MKKTIIGVLAAISLLACGPMDDAPQSNNSPPDSGSISPGQVQQIPSQGTFSNTGNVSYQYNTRCQDADCQDGTFDDPRIDEPIDPLQVMHLKDPVEREALQEKYFRYLE